MLYNSVANYLKTKYGAKVRKLCIDGGFSCPNRDGKCGIGGCIFCGERGSGEHLTAALDVGYQVRGRLNFARDGEKYVAYFQNFTNTYAPVSELKEKYDAALIDEKIVVLAIGTRPDCIDEEVVKLLASYKDRVDVWVELGLQTSNDKTADLINRGYKSEVFTKAVELLNKYGIDVVAHIIIGLPGEDKEDIKNTVEFINSHKLFGIKVHSIYVLKGTRLAELYERNEYIPPSFEYYLDCASYVLTHISPELVIHRLTGDADKELFIAPQWNNDKDKCIVELRRKLEREGLYQGKYYKNRS